MLQFSSWSLDETRVVRGPARNVRLSRAEYLLLSTMAARLNQVVPIGKLSDVVPFKDPDATERDPKTMTVLLHKLRTKLRKAAVPGRIQNVFGEGYMLCDEAPMTLVELTQTQVRALKMALSIAEIYQPGIREKTGISV